MTALEQIAERELVALAGHDGEAFGELYRRYRGRVERFARARLRHVEDAEDVTSETFLRVLRGIGRYEDRGVRFSAWLFGIAANTVVDHRRRRRPVEDLDDHPDLAAGGSVEELVASCDRFRQVARAAGRLPASQRQAFALRWVADLTVDEVALRMRRTPGAVKQLLHRALIGVRAAVREPAGALELAS